MARSTMTEEQRAMAVALLANAIRKEEHLQARVRAANERGGLVPGVEPRRRDASYLQGMRDLLSALFGKTVADECYRTARAQALGEQTPR